MKTYYSVKVQSQNRNVTPAAILHSSEGHRDTERSGDAFWLSRWALYFSRNSCRKLYCCTGKVHVSSRDLNVFKGFSLFVRTPEGHLNWKTFDPVLTFTVWMAPPPRCSLRISITLFSVSVTERWSSRQAATGGQKRSEGSVNEAPREVSTGFSKPGKLRFLLNPDLPRPP